MTRIDVKVQISRQNVEDILWLMFDHHEFAHPNSVHQQTLRRLHDFGMLEERAHLLEAGLAHCYFVSREPDGEQKLLDYLKDIKVREERDRD